MPASAPRIVQFPVQKSRPSQAQSRKPQPKRRPWLRMAVLLCAVIYLCWAGSQLVRQEMRMRQLQQSYEELLAAQEKLQATNDSIQHQIDSLANDPAYLEQLAREMGMVKPNDTVYLPVDPGR